MSEEEETPDSPKQSSGLFAGLHLASGTGNEDEDGMTPKLRNPKVIVTDAPPDLEPPSLTPEASPVTDKLLGMLDSAEPVASSSHVEDPPQDEDRAEALAAETNEEQVEVKEDGEDAKEEEKNIEQKEEEEAAEEEQQKEEMESAAPVESSSFGGMISSWFGSSAPAPAEAPPEVQTEGTEADEAAETPVLDSDAVPVDEMAADTDPVPVDEVMAEEEARTPSEEPAVSTEQPTEDDHPIEDDQPRTLPEDTYAEDDSLEPPAAAGEEHVTVPAVVEELDTTAEQQGIPPPIRAAPSDEEPLEPAEPKMNEEDKQHLDEAFDDSESPAPASSTITERKTPVPRGLGEVHEDTPIPNSDASLRLLRKFAAKTRPRIITTYGGSKGRPIMSFIFKAKEDFTFVPFRELMDALYEEGEDPDLPDESDRLVDSVMGADGDCMAKARLAIAAFVYLFSVWGHTSSRYLELKDYKGQQDFSELMSASFDAASELAAYGCLDGVKICLNGETNRAIDMMAQSVFNADLSIERNELAALKFLLGAGCRVAPNGDALLHGTYLLQTIRILYHIYLTTESRPNKITARAALQQLTTSVFGRVIRTDADETFAKTPDNFPSQNHRDAFLVLRSICKLSMRSLPDLDGGVQNHVGLQSSGSNETWDERQDMSSSSGKAGWADINADAPPQHESAQLLFTSAVHPALESKLLALELILYVLQNANFGKNFIQRSGPQFQSAIRNYLCVSLLKNCTSDNTRVVNLSLRIFVPLVRNFRTLLKNEIEAFVTNVFFVILDSKNSPAEHKSIVVKTFDEICSDPTTLAEIFLNYDCDLSAVDLFHRIVNTLSMVSRTGIQEPRSSGLFMGSQSVARLEKLRNENRELRLAAMKALRQVLASLHASIVEPMAKQKSSEPRKEIPHGSGDEASEEDDSSENEKKSLVEIYGSKKKRRAEEAECILRFNRKPSAGIAYAAKCNHIDGTDPTDVARYLLKSKDLFDKTQIGEYLGREPDYQRGFSLKVLHEYVRLLDLEGLQFDDAIRFFLSGFRLPGEAQKIDRIMEKFAERFTEQNPEVFPTADVAFILAFSIIMLNTDLHNPAIKEDRRMTKEGFLRNNRGICDGQDLPEELLTSIFDRIKENPISLKEDDEARERAGDSSGNATSLPPGLSPATFFSSHYQDMDRARESNFQKERVHIVRTTESLLKRRRSHSVTETGKAASKSRVGKAPRQPQRFVVAEDSGLKDEYVSPMFDVTWGPALAAFSTAMESANGTMGSLISIASDEELELAAENAAETIEVCLTGFRFAIGTAGLCGNDVARDAYMLALAGFSQLGAGVLLEPRHIRCIQTMLSLAREDGELLFDSWEHVFKALSEVNRYHNIFHLMARNDRAAAAAAQRRKERMKAKENRRKEMERRRAAAEDGESVATDFTDESVMSDPDDSLAESDLFEDEDFPLEEEMDSRAIDEANARSVYDAVSEVLIEGIFERSSSLSAAAVKVFVKQLCSVSTSEISVRSTLKSDGKRSDSGSSSGKDQFHHSQPNIYSLQKLVEVSHYNMDSRPRLIFAELWTIVAEHLTNTALHSNPAVAMYAVDSFRQLSIQYLRRDELEVFEFQKRFLKPLEVVMSRSDQSSTKELLLNCVARLIQVFGEDSGNIETKKKGGLKSGWVPILQILGLAGQDNDEGISKLSSEILISAIENYLQEDTPTTVLLSEHFVETVNALLLFVEGPHDTISLGAIDQLLLLTRFLADSAIELPQLKRRVSGAVPLEQSKQELELWWPILLGLSRAVGDPRLEVRSKGLNSLEQIVNTYFFPDDTGVCRLCEGADENMQTLQLIFRGVLTPILEFAETGVDVDGAMPALPEDFEMFLLETAKMPKKHAEEAVEETLFSGTSWLETTFDMFLDVCVRICLRSVKTFYDPSLIDEVFAILNNCLISDCGSVALRGLNRLEQFVTSDLDTQLQTDDVWATVSHMLRRCLTVRGLPPPAPVASPDSPPAEGEEADAEYKMAVQEFIAEEMHTVNRRYVGSNAALIVGLLLTNDRFAVALRWRLFLIAGLGRGIVEWGRAASILQENDKKKRKREEQTTRPPDYRETSVYGRKWMNRLLLQLAANKDIAQAPSDADPKTNRSVAGQKLVMDETQRLLSRYLEVEKDASEYRHTPADEILYAKFTELVKELLVGYQNMGADHLSEMPWLSPILLGSCIQCKNEEIRLMVQKLVQGTTPGSTAPYPTPPAPKSEQEEASEKPTEEQVEEGPSEESEANEGGTEVEESGDAVEGENSADDRPAEPLKEDSTSDPAAEELDVAEDIDIAVEEQAPTEDGTQTAAVEDTGEPEVAAEVDGAASTAEEAMEVSPENGTIAGLGAFVVEDEQAESIVGLEGDEQEDVAQPDERDEAKLIADI